MNTTKRLLCCDLDGTLLGDDASLLRFASAWEGLRNSRPGGFILCYNTGRSAGSALGVIEKSALPKPDHLITGVGTQIIDMAAGKPDVAHFCALAACRWDAERVAGVLREFPRVSPQPAECNSAYKSSWFLHDASDLELARIRERLGEAGLDFRLVYSEARNLDLLPACAGKGAALERLAARLGVAHDDILVAGDSGNDAEMLTLPGVHGVIVANHSPELARLVLPIDRTRLHLSRLACAAGVHEALARIGWLAA